MTVCIDRALAGDDNAAVVPRVALKCRFLTPMSIQEQQDDARLLGANVKLRTTDTDIRIPICLAEFGHLAA